MYFLDNYENILITYRDATNHDENTADVEEKEFYRQMAEAREYFTRMQDKILTQEDVKNIAAMYYSLFLKFQDTLLRTGYSRRTELQYMEEEFNAITFMDPTRTFTDPSRESTMKGLLAFAKTEPDPQNLTNIAYSRYMAEYADADNTGRQRTADLENDVDRLKTLSTILEASKNHVHGSSQYFDEMEDAFLKTKVLAERLYKENQVDAQSLQTYKKSLEVLNQKAERYQLYKETYAEQHHKHLKAKEVRRVDFSKSLQTFAGSRVHQFAFNSRRHDSFTAMIAAEEKKHKAQKTALKNSYEVRMKNTAKEVHEFERYCTDQQFSAKRLLNNTDWFQKTPEYRAVAKGKRVLEESVYIHNLAKLLKGTFGGICTDPKIKTAQQQFLKTGKLDHSSKKAVYNAASQAKEQNPAAYGQARNQAIDALALKVSSMNEPSADFLLITGLIETLAKDDETDKNQEMSKDETDMVNGIHAVSGMIHKGMHAWEKLNHSKTEKTNDVLSEIIDFAVMKVLSTEMKAFCKANTGTVNPLFAKLGKDPECAEILRWNVQNSQAFNQLLKKPFENIAALTRKSDAASNKLFAEIATESIQKTLETMERNQNRGHQSAAKIPDSRKCADDSEIHIRKNDHDQHSYSRKHSITGFALSKRPNLNAEPAISARHL